jgi:hypothetical protein
LADITASLRMDRCILVYWFFLQIYLKPARISMFLWVFYLQNFNID